MKLSIVFTTLIFSLSLFAQPVKGAGPGWTSFLKKFDFNQDGQISQDEFLAGSQTRFTDLDANGDSIIIEDEFQSGIQSRHGKRRHHKGKDRSHGALIKAADTNQDQTISIEEWNIFVENMEVDDNGSVILGQRHRENAGPPRGLFAELDVNQNGIFEKDEFAGLFQLLDKNGDGMLTIQEMPCGKKSKGRNRGGWITTSDSNKDRVITSEEWALFLSQHQNEDGSIDLAAVLQGPMIDRMTQKLDQNQNGLIELEEIQVIFDRKDRNGDGQISEDDRISGRKGRSCPKK